MNKGNGTDDRGEGKGRDQGLDGGGALSEQGQEGDKQQEKALMGKEEAFETDIRNPESGLKDRWTL